MSDSGDGWNSTYAIAFALAQPKLELGADDGNGDRWQVPRADVLVFGGDEVYPTPSREACWRRLIVLYETAFGDARPDSHHTCLPFLAIAAGTMA